MSQVEKNKVVSISYQLKKNNDEVVDQVTKEDPLNFVYGIGQTLPKLEEQISGLNEGDSFSFELQPQEAFGEYSDENIVDIPKNVFDQAPEGTMQEGNTVPMQDQEGNNLQGTVKEVKDENVTMDFNHPLADHTLQFEGEILNVRDASEEEINNGQVKQEGEGQNNN